MSENHQTEPIDMGQTPFDSLEIKLNNIYHSLYLIDKRLEDLSDALEANIANVSLLEEAISQTIDIPTRPMRIRYDHRENKLWVNEQFPIEFKGGEAEVIGLMFFSSSGLPKKTKFQYAEIAEQLRDKASPKNEPTKKAIKLRVDRIQAKLKRRLNTKNLLIVKTDEFYFHINNR